MPPTVGAYKVGRAILLREGVTRRFAERAFHDGTRFRMRMASTGPPFLRTQKLEAASLAELVMIAERLGILAGEDQGRI